MAGKKHSKKKRLKVQKPSGSNRKKGMTVVDYIIWTVGGIAAIVVAVWGGYYLGLQSEEEGLSPAVNAIIIKAKYLKEDGKVSDAERVLNLALMKYKDEENLLVELADVYGEEGKTAEAEQLIHEKIKTLQLRYEALHKLRERYRKNKQDEASIRLSKELAALDAEIAAHKNAEPTPTEEVSKKEEKTANDESQQ